MKSSWVLSEEERYHRFRKQRERQKHHDVNGVLRPDQKESFMVKEDFDHDHDERFNVHSRNSHPSDEDDHHQDRDSSPGSSHGYGGIDSDTERSFHQFGSSGLSPHYVSPPPLSPPQNAIKNEPDFAGDASTPHLHTYFPMDFLTKHSEAFLQFELPPHSLLFPVATPVSDDVLMREARPESSRLSISHQENNMPAPPAAEAARSAPPPPPPPPTAPSPMPQEVDSMNMDEQSRMPPSERDRIGNILPPDLAAAVTADEVSQIKAIARIHDINYKSINFGEELIKEMVMSSVFKVPLSPSATMTAYRLMIQRVTKVAQGFDPFINLPYKMQSTLLKHNADLVILVLFNPNVHPTS